MTLPVLSCDLSTGMSVTFTATDDCGNTAQCTRTVYLDDSVAPMINCSGVSDLQLNCIEGTDYPALIETWIALVKTTILNDPGTLDACDGMLAISDNYGGTAIPPLSCDQTSGLAVVFTVTDECGNTAACTKMVYLDDNVAPRPGMYGGC
jgi:hypothetical protein